MTRSASIVGGAVFLSRILGLVREQVFAAFFGAGRAFDAYVIAIRIPSLFRDLLAEGALSSAFVKTFSHTLERDGEERAWRLASLMFSILALVVGILVGLLILVAPWVVDLMTPGAGFDADKRELTVGLTRVMFPFLLMVSLGAVSMGALNARNVYGVPALASSIFNLTSISVGLAVAFFLDPDYMIGTLRSLVAGEGFLADDASQERAILGMAYGVLVGGVAQFLWQIPTLRRRGFRYQPGIDLRDEGVRGVLRLMGPAVIGAAAVQVNVVVNSAFASSIEGNGPVSWLNYSFRLMQFPIGVFGVAIATATLPSISRATARGDHEEYRRTIAASLRLVLFLTLPSAVGLIVLAEPIIALIYQRGNFVEGDTISTAGALSCYALGLVGYSLIKVLAPAFYAIDDAKTPARISLLSIAVNFVLCSLLIHRMGHRGLALSTSLVATANAILLYGLLRRRVGPIAGPRSVGAIFKIAVASLLLGLVAFGAHQAISGSFDGAGLAARFARAFLPIVAGSAVYFAVGALLGVEELDRVREVISRRRKGGPRG